MTSLTIYLRSGKTITIDQVTEWEAKKNSGEIIGLTYNCIKGTRNVSFVRPKAIDCIVEHQTHADRITADLIGRINQLEAGMTDGGNEERGGSEEGPDHLA